MTPAVDRVLDHAVWHALTGPQRSFAAASGVAVRYRQIVAPFGAIRPGSSDGDPAGASGAWSDLARLVGPGGTVGLSGDRLDVPAGWEVVREGQALQLVGTGVVPEVDPEAVALGVADVPDMLALIERTRPGPFLPETVTLGGYVGIRFAGRLVAMAGERMRPPGHAEISAVATLPAVRGKGLATRLVRSVAAAVSARGETPFLHVAVDNVDAVRLYRRLGFEERRVVVFQHVRRAPG
ncbi:MAG: GNAT family N-acetyltransferase [Actinomycetota bacterium]|nr:GNAT family N-acetyltransferase [Actinomycetota bacterium]